MKVKNNPKTHPTRKQTQKPKQKEKQHTKKGKIKAVAENTSVIFHSS